MGREAETIAHWNGQIAPVKALLESDALILRGAIRAKLPRGTLTDARVEAGALHLSAGGEALALELGEREAARWLAALTKPLPTLAEKLGVTPERPAFVTGETPVPELDGVLDGARAGSPEGAAQIIAILASPADLDAALALAVRHPALPIWCVHAKGKAADPGDSIVRTAFRAAGWMDSKSCAVSDRFTATRYGRKG